MACHLQNQQHLRECSHLLHTLAASVPFLPPLWTQQSKATELLPSCLSLGRSHPSVGSAAGLCSLVQRWRRQPFPPWPPPAFHQDKRQTRAFSERTPRPSSHPRPRPG